MEVDDTEFEKEIQVNIDDIEIAPIKESSSVVQLFTGWCPVFSSHPFSSARELSSF